MSEWKCSWCRGHNAVTRSRCEWCDAPAPPGTPTSDRWPCAERPEPGTVAGDGWAAPETYADHPLRLVEDES